MTFAYAVRFIDRAPLSCREFPPSLLRMKLLLRLLGDPQQKTNYITVGGDREADTLKLISEIVVHGGYGALAVDASRIRSDPSECITVNCRPVLPLAFAQAVGEVYYAAQKIKKSYDSILGGADGGDGIDAVTQLFFARGISPEPTAEEIIVATAAVLSKENGCRISVLPVMFGGRNSPLSALPLPMACFVCPLSEQNCSDILLSLIVRGVKEVVTEPQLPEVLSKISRNCADSGARLTVTLKSEINILKKTLRLTEFTYRDEEILTLMTPVTELVNKACAAVELAGILSRNGFPIGFGSVKKSIYAYRADKRTDICTISAEPAIFAASTEASESAILEVLAALEELRTHLGGTFYVFDMGLGFEDARSVMKHMTENYGRYYDRMTVVCPENSGFCGYSDNEHLKLEYADISLNDIVSRLHSRDAAICFFSSDRLEMQTDKLLVAIERRNIGRSKTHPT